MPVKSKPQILARLVQLGIAGKGGPQCFALPCREEHRGVGLGIIDRRVDPLDKRWLLVKLNQTKLLAALDPPAPQKNLQNVANHKVSSRME